VIFFRKKRGIFKRIFRVVGLLGINCEDAITSVFQINLFNKGRSFK
jgi:hypothetical protein